MNYIKRAIYISLPLQGRTVELLVPSSAQVIEKVIATIAIRAYLLL